MLNGDLPFGMAEAIVKCIEDERGKQRLVNQGGAEEAEEGRLSDTMNQEELKAELDRRIALMRAGGPEGTETDQIRVFEFIIGELQSSRYLRLMIQGSV